MSREVPLLGPALGGPPTLLKSNWDCGCPDFGGVPRPALLSRPLLDLPRPLEEVSGPLEDAGPPWPDPLMDLTVGSVASSSF
eukprot:787403-Lingulodinium_polyedra.AAC.1